MSAVDQARRAIFLDKDGTLIENVPYNVDPARIALTRGAGEALRRLGDAGYILIVVSNQPGVAQGRFGGQALDAVEARLRSLLAENGVVLAGCYWCPHAPSGRGAFEEGCDCRKPAPGLVLRAARRHGVDLAQSWLIGDILDDIEAGCRAGCRTILLDNGNETLWEWSALRWPHYIVPTLAEAASAILDESVASLPVDALET